MTTIADIQDRVKEVLETGYTFGPVDEDSSLIEAGYVDSVSIVGLTLELEKRFQIQIPSSDMTPENWQSVRSISTMCARLVMSTTEGPPRRSLFDMVYGSATLIDLLRNELARAGRLGYGVSLVVFQLDGKLDDSDTSVLTATWLEAGQALTENLRVEDTVTMIKLPDGKTAMLGILPHTSGASVKVAVMRVGRRLFDKLAGRYPVTKLQYGVATFPDDGREIQELVRKSCGTWHELSVDDLKSADAPAAQAQAK